MKRDENIVTLSRDHHTALLFCWKIRQGIKRKVTTERIHTYVQYFWNNHLEQHFKEEETILFAAIQDSLCEQAIAEHKELRKTIAATATTDNLNLLADTLDNHIRFEERILFPHLEKILAEETLAAIGKRLQAMHETHPKDLYADEFWV